MYNRYKRDESLCPICFEPIEDTFLFDELMNMVEICSNCRPSLECNIRIFKRRNIKIIGIYKYDGLIRDLILRYKNYGDEYISLILMKRFRWISRLFKRKVVCVPSIKDNDIKRGFKSSSLLAKMAGFEVMEEILIHKGVKAQKEKNKIERTQIINDIVLKNKDLIKDMDIILFDDVITTGYTIEACYKLLKPYVKSIKVVVCAYKS